MKFYFNKVFALILIFFLLLTSFFSVYANNYIDTKYDYLYDYKLSESTDELKQLEQNVLKDDRVASGEYYYFITYNIGHWAYETTLVKKSSCPLVSYITFGNWNANGPELFYFTLMSVNSYHDGDIIGTLTACPENTSYYGVFNCANFDSDNKTYTFYPFVTNYVGDIVRKCYNGDMKYLVRKLPYIADTDYTLSKLDGSYFLIFPNVDNVENLHFSLCETQTVEGDLPYDKEVVLADFPLNDTSSYYKEVDGESWYEVPYSAFPSGLTITSGNEYNWRLQFDLLGSTQYVNRNVVSEVDYTFTGSTRWR